MPPLCALAGATRKGSLGGGRHGFAARTLGQTEQRCVSAMDAEHTSSQPSTLFSSSPFELPLTPGLPTAFGAVTPSLVPHPHRLSPPRFLTRRPGRTRPPPPTGDTTGACGGRLPPCEDPLKGPGGGVAFQHPDCLPENGSSTSLPDVRRHWRTGKNQDATSKQRLGPPPGG